MDVFLSWSGESSKMLATIFEKWISNVIPTLDIYFSTKEISPGERWSNNVASGLEDNSIGIFFILKDNISNPWVNFEAGAISKNIEKSRVIPLLHQLKPEEITGPMAQFQAMSISRNNLFRVVKEINDSLTDSRHIPSENIQIIFDKWYPEFEESYETFSKENPTLDTDNKSNNSDMTSLLDTDSQVAEILKIVRNLKKTQDKTLPITSWNHIGIFAIDGEVYRMACKSNIPSEIANKYLQVIEQLSFDLGRLPAYVEIAHELDRPAREVKENIRIRRKVKKITKDNL